MIQAFCAQPARGASPLSSRFCPHTVRKGTKVLSFHTRGQPTSGPIESEFGVLRFCSLSSSVSVSTTRTRLYPTVAAFPPFRMFAMTRQCPVHAALRPITLGVLFLGYSQTTTLLSVCAIVVAVERT